MTGAERRSALEAIAAEVRVCRDCRLHEGRTRSVPGEGDPDTEVVFVGEGPGFNEDRQGRPFVGRAGDLLVKLLASIGWRREDVFITNVVKCRPPDNRDPLPDEIAACAPYLQRQLEVLDPAVVVTLGRYSMGRFMPGARISSAHGTVRPIDPSTGARDALAFAMYHPAAALRTPAIERESYADIASVPMALLDARARRTAAGVAVAEAAAATTDSTDSADPADPAEVGASVGIETVPGAEPSFAAGATADPAATADQAAISIDATAPDPASTAPDPAAAADPAAADPAVAAADPPDPAAAAADRTAPAPDLDTLDPTAAADLDTLDRLEYATVTVPPPADDTTPQLTLF